jgi:hypothetical protein
MSASGPTACVQQSSDNGLSDLATVCCKVSWVDDEWCSANMKAIFSDDRRHRYTLERMIPSQLVGETNVERGDTVLFVCLNPSTADEVHDDPTVRRCVGYAKRWGFSRLVVCNIFALRSTDPRALYEHPDPVGPENDRHLLGEAIRADRLVAAWGFHGGYKLRGASVLQMLLDVKRDVHMLGQTKDGHPRHPLYLRTDAEPVLWLPTQRRANARDAGGTGSSRVPATASADRACPFASSHDSAGHRRRTRRPRSALR